MTSCSWHRFRINLSITFQRFSIVLNIWAITGEQKWQKRFSGTSNSDLFLIISVRYWRLSPRASRKPAGRFHSFRQDLELRESLIFGSIHQRKCDFQIAALRCRLLRLESSREVWGTVASSEAHWKYSKHYIRYVCECWANSSRNKPQKMPKRTLSETTIELKVKNSSLGSFCFAWQTRGAKAKSKKVKGNWVMWESEGMRGSEWTSESSSFCERHRKTPRC